MVELVLVYCLVANGGQCIERRTPLEAALTPFACLTSAQQVALAYTQEHPQWRLSKWRCEAAGASQGPA